LSFGFDRFGLDRFDLDRSWASPYIYKLRSDKASHAIYLRDFLDNCGDHIICTMSVEMEATPAQALSNQIIQRQSSFSSKRHPQPLQRHHRSNWIDGTASFWYLQASEGKKTFVMVDAKNSATQPAFDHAKLASALAKASGQPVDPLCLPFSEISLSGSTLGFSAMKRHGSTTSKAAQSQRLPTQQSLSRRDALPRWHNGSVRQRSQPLDQNVSSGDKYPLTSDGQRTMPMPGGLTLSCTL
jgi:hypothetical protein